MPDIEVTLKIKDELTKGMEKVADVMGEVDEETMKLGKRFNQIGVNIGDMSDEFLDLNPNLKAYKELTEKAAEESKKLEGAIEDVGDATSKVDKVGGDFNKQLKGMVKGFVGVTGAIVAGRAIANFTKDSLAAADAAGRLPPIFAELSKTTASFKEEFGVSLANTIEPAVTAASKLGKVWASDLQVVNKYNAAVKSGLITQQDMNRVMKDTSATTKELVFEGTVAAGLGREVTTNARKQNEEILSNEEALKRLNVLEKERLQTAKDLNKQREAFAGVTVAERGPGEELRRATFLEGRFVPVEIVPFFEGLDPGILSAIQAEIEKGEFLLAGGERVQENLERAQRALDEGRISMERYLEIARNVEQQAIAIQVETGKITLREAALERMREYGGTVAENEQAILAVIDALNVLDGMKVRAFVDVEFSGVGTGAGIRTAGGRRAAGGPVTPGETFLVGERGPELFRPNNAGNIIPNNQIGRNQAGADMSVLEGKFDRLSRDMRTMVLEMTQAIAERG